MCIKEHCEYQVLTVCDKMRSLIVAVVIFAFALSGIVLAGDRFDGVRSIDERVLANNPDLVAILLGGTYPRRNARITGGQGAFHGQFPHQVAMFCDFPAGARYFCGGSLLDENTVITAAHCVDE